MASNQDVSHQESCRLVPWDLVKAIEYFVGVKRELPKFLLTDAQLLAVLRMIDVRTMITGRLGNGRIHAFYRTPKDR